MEKVNIHRPARYWTINTTVIVLAYVGFVEGVEFARVAATVVMWLCFALSLLIIPLFPLVARQVGGLNPIRETFVDAPIIWFAILGGAYLVAAAYAFQLVLLILVRLAQIYVYEDKS